MHSTNSPDTYSGSAMRTSAPMWCCRPKAHSSSMTAASGRNTPRLYQRSLSKHRTKVSRYSDSGSTQRNGTAATFWVMWFVTASSSHDASAGSASHSR